MAKTEILLFEYYLLASRLFSLDFIQKAKERATGASSIGQTDTWHDEVFKIALVEKVMEATRYDKLKSRLLSPSVIWPEYAIRGKSVHTGAVVRIREEGYPEEEYLLTGDTIIPEYGFITIRSPLGASLLNSKEGSKLRAKMPAGLMEIEVLRVNYDILPMLTNYFRNLYDKAEQYLKEMLTSQSFARFLEIAKQFQSGAGGADAERDYYELTASIVIHTATLEAILFIFEAYQFSNKLEEDCRRLLTEQRLFFEENGIRFTSLSIADYCHPKRL